ncbi:C2H2-type domain-containing protein [Trichoderma simmonsii]|uniref:C2H2-type domain-containing protein n=1 Tax=Trichoderma simmonsii TaxID=1491479 RepID=A0A8G0L782_9HYPO|nr:C2H2-type domain-containing protein [Trichoderma simmonsii]
MAPFPCGVCKKKFNTRPRIISHALETGHNANQCCRVCLRWFQSTSAFAAHAKSAAHLEEEAKQSQSLSASVTDSKETSTDAIDSKETLTDAPPPVQLQFGDVCYTCLTHQQQDEVFNQLSAKCHSVEILEKEGYILDVEKGPTTKKQKPRPSLADFQQTPPVQPATIKRRAVVVDCEMAETTDGSDELVSLYVMDFLTGETLIDSLVLPSRPIADWRAKIHGINATIMSEAAAHQNALRGWAAAREELWKHVDESTILVGQSILFDFEALRLIHMRVMDSAILATEAVFNKTGKKYRKPRRRWGLQELCEKFLGIQIRNGDGIHSNMEDVLAAREVVLQCLLKPENFKEWADKAREDFWKPKEGSKNQKKKKTKRPTHQIAKQAAPALETIEDSEDIYYILDDDDISYDFEDVRAYCVERDWFIDFGADIAYYE